MLHLHPAHFEPANGPINHTCRCAAPAAGLRWPLVTLLRTFCGALREALAASRQYEQLRTRGVPHDKAIREALGLGLSAPQASRRRRDPLYFAGRM